MDRLEQFTKKFLDTQGFRDVLFEPRGVAMPPDFGVGDHLAVESTRLTKAVQGFNITEMIYPAASSLGSAIESIKLGNQNRSFYIDVDYLIEGTNNNRHRKNIRKLKEKLGELRNQKLVAGTRYEVSDDLKIEIGQSSRAIKTQFHLGAFGCEDSYGWVASDLLEQCQAALAKKKGKMEEIGNEYQEWWLAVGSNLTVGIRDSVFQSLSENLHGERFWDRIVLIDGNDPHRSQMISFNK